MSINILTSDFPKGFPLKFSQYLLHIIPQHSNFVFVASSFECGYDITDHYFHHILELFTTIGVAFHHTTVVDGRMNHNQAQQCIQRGDVIWLAGGDTVAQYKYLEQYGLITSLRHQDGIVIGMSAGAINMCKTAICTTGSGHNKSKVYSALGLVDISITPHYINNTPLDELEPLSIGNPIYALCDNSAIVISGEDMHYYGAVFMINNGEMRQVSFD